MPIGIVYHPIYLEHDTGRHPESAQRLEAVVAHLRATGMWSRLEHVPPRAASTDDLLRVHTAQHLETIAHLARTGGGTVDVDTVVSPRSDEVARYAAGGTIAAVEALLQRRVSAAYALIRPPGHHATASRAMGFCLYNNVAVAARWSLEVAGVQRLAIIDIDVHHGNGTAEAFATDPRVLYVSLHQSNLFPGTGRWRESGRGPGEGALFHIPLPPHTGDEGYLQAFERLVLPAVRRFAPDLLLVSIGYDAHWADPLSSTLVSLVGYRAMADSLVALAGELCRGHIALALEGGYDTDVLARGVHGTLASLMGTESEDPLGRPREPETDVNSLIDAIARKHHLE